jgi:hypothetical protein
MAVGRRIHSRQWITAAATGFRQMIMGLLAAFHWQQLWPGSWMAWLATPLAATAFARGRVSGDNEVGRG